MHLHCFTCRKPTEGQALFLVLLNLIFIGLMDFFKWFLCGSYRFSVCPSEILSKLEFQHLPEASNIMKNLFQGKHDYTLISKWIFFHNCFFDFTYKFVYVGYGGIRVLGGADP